MPDMCYELEILSEDGTRSIATAYYWKKPTKLMCEQLWFYHNGGCEGDPEAATKYTLKYVPHDGQYISAVPR